jgi:hypothetical protein
MQIRIIGAYRTLSSSAFPPRSLTVSCMGNAEPEGSRSSTSSTGLSNPDGTALLSASGITGKQEHNLGLVTPGVPYSYTVKALFKGSLGTGDSIGARVRTFRFTKK